MPGRAAKEGERERGAASAGGMGGARSPHVCGGRDIGSDHDDPKHSKSARSRTQRVGPLTLALLCFS
jgi:hypothetical protein